MQNNVAERKLTEFFKTDVRDFSIYSCERSIPSGIDGLKTAQRKVIFGMMKKFPSEEVKVSIASAAIMAESCYHHGSLDGVVVNMSQSFAGSNNLPLLEGIGQFGSRISPEAAATRYIFTKLSNTFGKLISSDDAPILEHKEDDGTIVEPTFYLPIIPLVLINGADGMGTGFATYIMGYNPDDIKKRCLDILNGKKIKDQLTPWYTGFSGKISRINDQVIIEGCIEVVNSTTLKITELPVGQYTSRYRETLNKLESDGIIKTYDDNSSEEKTEFIIKTTREFITGSTPESLLKTFKLVSKSTENFTVWDQNRKIRKFKSADDLVEWFVDYRLIRYTDRKISMISRMEDQLVSMNERIRFIKLYIKSSSEWSKKEASEIESILMMDGFSDPQSLMSIRVSRLTGTAIKELEADIVDLQTKLDTLKKTDVADLYKADLMKLKFA